jgi:RNA recognition motif-containing protein
MNEHRFAKPNCLPKYNDSKRARLNLYLAELKISKTPTNMIKVSNLPNTPVTIKDIKKVFSCYGDIDVIELKSLKRGMVDNFATITYYSHNDAIDAFEDVNFEHDVEIDDFVLKVEYLEVSESDFKFGNEISREKLGYDEDPRDWTGKGGIQELGDCATDDED